jgi:alkylated DNA repair dioxygenase AlkB
LLNLIDRQPWSGELKRRVQHYGYKYDYKKRAVIQAMYLGELPAWAKKLAGRLHQQGFTPQIPDQLIVNEYKPGQGIASHIDCVSCFGDPILCLSLGSACVMNFTHIPAGIKAALLLQPGSLLILQGEARYQWHHSIAPRKRDKYRGAELARTRRVSLTFRTVLKR